MLATIFSLLASVASIIDKQLPGFAAQTQEKINALKEQYEDELGKDWSDIDAAKLDSLDLQLRDLIAVFNSAVQPTNNSSKS